MPFDFKPFEVGMLKESNL